MTVSSAMICRTKPASSSDWEDDTKPSQRTRNPSSSSIGVSPRGTPVRHPVGTADSALRGAANSTSPPPVRMLHGPAISRVSPETLGLFSSLQQRLYYTFYTAMRGFTIAQIGYDQRHWLKRLSYVGTAGRLHGDEPDWIVRRSAGNSWPASVHRTPTLRSCA